MTGIDVDLAVLGTIATDLSSGAETLDALTVPDGPDAGIMSGLISSLLGQITTSTANVIATMSAAGDNVELAQAYYARADAESEATMDEIARVMDES